MIPPASTGLSVVIVLLVLVVVAAALGYWLPMVGVLIGVALSRLQRRWRRSRRRGIPVANQQEEQ